MASVPVLNEYGGYDHDFVETRDVYNCPICTLVIRETRETDCGHRFCRTCIEQVRKIQERASNFCCPVCKTGLNLNLIYPSKACDREIQSLDVRCKQEDGGASCQWSGELRALENHINKECAFTKVQCTNKGCSLNMFRHELLNHIDNICGYTPFPCGHCSMPVRRRKWENHQEHCLKWPVSCKNYCGISALARDLIEQHYKECPMAVLPCEYAGFGCEFKGVLEQRNQHDENSTKQHLNYAVARIRTLDARVHTLEKKEKTFIWCIPNYQNQREEAKRIYSQPFYTSEHGYKLRLLADLNGIGDGKGTHVSLYLQGMKGEYDGILKWPFKLKHALYLLPQKEGVEAIEYQLNPNDEDEDKLLISYSRPTDVVTDCNAGLGFSNFVS